MAHTLELDPRLISSHEEHNASLIWPARSCHSVVFYSGLGDTGLFLDSPVPTRSPWHGCLFAVAMVMGILAGKLSHRNLDHLRQELVPRKLLTTLWSDRELWKSSLASPIVFGVIYSLLSETHDIVMATILSFQNGFFCNIVFENKRSEVLQATQTPGGEKWDRNSRHDGFSWREAIGAGPAAELGRSRGHSS